MLHPENLTRYAARWIDPDPAVRDVVDTYWHVRWHLDAGEAIDQTIVDLPAVTLTVETGDVPADLVVTGLHRGAWQRRIAGLRRRLRDPAAPRRARGAQRAATAGPRRRDDPAHRRRRRRAPRAPGRHRGRERTPDDRARVADELRRGPPPGAPAAAGRTCWPTGSSTSCAPAPTAGPARPSPSTSRSASARPAGTVGDARHRPQAGGPAHPAAGGRAGDRGARRRRPRGDRRRSSATPTRPTSRATSARRRAPRRAPTDGSSGGSPGRVRAGTRCRRRRCPRPGRSPGRPWSR